MTDKVIRIFKIINAIQSNPGITAADLAFRCDVNIRTIYRDLDVISHFAPVTNEGRGTGYRFLGNFFSIRLISRSRRHWLFRCCRLCCMRTKSLQASTPPMIR